MCVRVCLSELSVFECAKSVLECAIVLVCQFVLKVNVLRVCWSVLRVCRND